MKVRSELKAAEANERDAVSREVEILNSWDAAEADGSGGILVSGSELFLDVKDVDVEYWESLGPWLNSSENAFSGLVAAGGVVESSSSSCPS